MDDKKNLIQKLLLFSQNRHKKNAFSSNFFLLAIEEALFWIGLVALLTGNGWVSIMGGVLLLGSLVLIFKLLQ